MGMKHVAACCFQVLASSISRDVEAGFSFFGTCQSTYYSTPL
jgi:hypothetical protein